MANCIRRCRWAPAAAIALALGAPAVGQAAGQAGGPLAACADPSLPYTTTLNTCQLALQDGGLTPAQRAGVLTNLGVAQAALRRHGDAELSFSLAIQTDPGLIAAYANRARSRLALGRRAEALADFSAAIDRAPRDAALYLGRGGVYLRDGRAEEAAADFSEALRIDAGLADAAYNRGIAFLLLGRAREAEADFSRVIAAAPEDAGAFLYRARARQESDPVGAVGDFDRAIALDGEWGRAWAARGLFHEAQGRQEAANRDFLRAYELGETEPWLLDRIAKLTR